MAVEKEPLASRTRRNIDFHPTCTIVLIPSRNEYKAAGLYSCLWWSTDDYFGFQQSAISEVRMLMNSKNIAVKKAKRMLYQPNEALDDEIIGEKIILNEFTHDKDKNNDDDSVPTASNSSKGVTAISSNIVTSSISDVSNENIEIEKDSFYLGDELGDIDDEDEDNNETLVNTSSNHSEQSEETPAINKKLSRVSSLECIDTSKVKRTLAQSTSYMNLNSSKEESIVSYDCLCLCVPLPQGSNIIFDRKKRRMASAFTPFHGPIIVVLLIVVVLLLVDRIF